MTLVLPSAFAERMSRQLGNDFPAFENAIQSDAPVSVRLNPFKPSDRFTNESIVPWCSAGRYLKQRPVFTLDPLFHAGCYYVQEASSMYLEVVFKSVVSTDMPLKVLDLCGAPGGKSTLLRSIMSDDSLLVSNEIIPSRNYTLVENLVKWGQPGIIVTRNDPSDFEALTGYFDVIVVDAPCSGEGLFRKDPSAAGEWSVAHVDSCAYRQKQIVSSVCGSLKPGGILIYSTCTWSEQEDEGVVRELISHHQFEPLSLPHYDGITACPEGMRFYPHRIKGEGFFISALRKPIGSSGSVSQMQRPYRGFEPVTKKARLSAIDLYVNPRIPQVAFQSGDTCWLIPEKLKQDWMLLSSVLRVVYAGCRAGEWKGDSLLPSAELALNLILNQSVTRWEADRESALRYLKGDALQFSGDTPGWLLIVHQGHPLGWGKAVGRRINNGYPKEWRIRMDITGG